MDERAPHAAVDEPDDGPAGARDEPERPALGRLTLIGAGHVFAIEEAIEDAIHALRPDRVFVELDRGRLVALVQKASGQESGPAARGNLLHRRLERFQSRVAQGYGTQVGSEMLAAVRAAQSVGAQLALIDRPAQATLQRVVKQLTWREKLRGAGMVLASPLRSLWARLRRRRSSDSIEDEIRRYEDDPAAVLDELGRQFPTVRRIIIDERDELMARRLRDGLAGIDHGVAVVGDGHVNGLLQHLETLEPDLDPVVFRLADVRQGRLPKPDMPATVRSDDTDEVSFGFTVGG